MSQAIVRQVERGVFRNADPRGPDQLPPFMIAVVCFSRLNGTGFFYTPIVAVAHSAARERRRFPFLTIHDYGLSMWLPNCAELMDNRTSDKTRLSKRILRRTDTLILNHHV